MKNEIKLVKAGFKYHSTPLSSFKRGIKIAELRHQEKEVATLKTVNGIAIYTK